MNKLSMMQTKLLRITFSYVLTFLFSIGLVSIVGCSSDDSSWRPIIDEPSGDDDDDDNGELNFTYNPQSSLKDLAAYPVGMIVSAAKLSSSSDENESFKSILTDDYNSITAENDMKMANMFTAADTYDWSDGDEIVAYAKENNMRVHGHALLWHQSIPGWLNNFDGSDEEFETLIENYIKEAVSHFAQETFEDGTPVVASWDVVNEAFDGAQMRNSLFFQRMGEDYVAKCFQWAREVDSDVKLFYNDYNIAGEGTKRNSVINMVNNFASEGIPIDGVGLQMHVNHDWPTTNEINQAITAIANTGLLVHLSELDVKVNFNDDLEELTLERAQEQEKRYQEVAEAYANVPEEQQFGITIWGMRDRDSWLYEGGLEWPLLYNNNFEYKVAHRGFAEGLE